MIRVKRNVMKNDTKNRRPLFCVSTDKGCITGSFLSLQLFLAVKLPEAQRCCAGLVILK
jgi:hypothetical protein